MAEPTINLGGGNWAGKSDNLLGYYKEGERFYKQDFTFSRSTTGTYKDKDGYIQEMPYNLLQQSNDFDTTWTKDNTTLTSGQSGYDGSSDAWKLTKSSNQYAKLIQAVSISDEVTYSFYIKADSLNYAIIYIDASTDVAIWVDLTNGTITNTLRDDLVTNKQVESLQNGWYRCSISTNQAVSHIRIFPNDTSTTYGTTSGSIYIQDAQLVKGTSAKTYFPTTTRLNMPRVDYLNNSNGSLILEPQRSNLLNYSSDFSQSYYTKSQVTITSNDTTSPDGTQNSDKVVETTNNSEHIFYRAGISTLGTISIYAKADNSGRLFQIRRDAGTGTNSWAWFNLDNGTVESEDAGVASIESLSNNWYRCIFTPTNASGTIVFSISNGATTRSVSYEGNGTSGVYIYGAMLEAGSYPTSLINTSGSSVTRNQDICSLTNVADRINSSEGVLYAEIAALDYDGTDRRISLSDGTSNNYITIGYSRFSTNIVAEIVSSGVLQTSDWGATGVTQKNNNKFALSWGSGTMKFYVNGSKTQTKNITSPIGMDDLRFSAANGSLRMFSNTRDLRVYNTALSDTELAELTT